MKTTALVTILILAATQVMAAEAAAEAQGCGIMTIICAAFVALILLSQFLPGLTLLFGAFKGVFGGHEAVHPKRAGE